MQPMNRSSMPLLLLCASSMIAGPAIASGDPLVECRACHSVKRGEPPATGPNLFGVYGARIALRKGFVYSAALKRHNGTWNDEALNAWLESPQTYAPGTKMAFSGLQDPESRQRVIDALKKLK